MNPPTEGPAFEQWLISLTGDVQGGGIRPRLAQLAQRYAIGGFVRNSRFGVELQISGESVTLQQFIQQVHDAEPQARIEYLSRLPADPVTAAKLFTIESSSSTGVGRCHIPLDRIICEACLVEIADPNHRRYRYPFNSCTRCGPRYSLLRAMPYDRQRTSMADFAMCPECLREYQAPQDRRFYSQLNACPQCGPRVWLSIDGDDTHCWDDAAIVTAAERIKSGEILALKGIGGYQLVCDALCKTSVARLRAGKSRPFKPLAVMVPNLEAASQLAWLDPVESRALSSPIGPIVLVRARPHCGLAENIHAQLKDVGLMLPTSALHALLLWEVDRPLVVTSGNLEGEPMEYEPPSASQRLSAMADCFLHHDRAIERPIDDSVVRCMSGRIVTFRAARGLAPMPLECVTRQSTLAVGGDQKVALGLASPGLAFLGPHLGDMNSLGSQERFRRQQSDFTTLLDGAPQVVISDRNDDYFTARWTLEQLPNHRLTVQHHQAHILAGMLDHAWLDREVLGFAFDGTGLGPDGTIWGGEGLLVSLRQFERIAHVRPFALAGGEMAIRQPWRIAVALMMSALDMRPPAIAAFLGVDEASVNNVVSISRVPRLAPMTTSMGRLFDGVAAIALAIHTNRFEGDAASQLESCCDPHAIGEYTLPLTQASPAQWDWRPMVRAMVTERLSGETPGVIAYRFHAAIARGMAELAALYPRHRVVCMGGVFQNRLLCEMLSAIWRHREEPVGLPGRIPPGDGGLAAGQIAAASAT